MKLYQQMNFLCECHRMRESSKRRWSCRQSQHQSRTREGSVPGLHFYLCSVFEIVIFAFIWTSKRTTTKSFVGQFVSHSVYTHNKKLSIIDERIAYFDAIKRKSRNEKPRTESTQSMRNAQFCELSENFRKLEIVYHAQFHSPFLKAFSCLIHFVLPPTAIMYNI